jgi:formylmethanofuran dehydrogenase subunit E
MMQDQSLTQSDKCFSEACQTIAETTVGNESIVLSAMSILIKEDREYFKGTFIKLSKKTNLSLDEIRESFTKIRKSGLIEKLKIQTIAESINTDK